jgi:predicted nucleotidyltransferase
MLTIHISDQELALINTVLKEHIPQYEVWAFGSRTTGKAKKFSDLDLVILSHEAIDLKILFALMNDFAESNLPFKVDIVDWSTIDQIFREIIRKNHVIIQNGPKIDSPQ